MDLTTPRIFVSGIGAVSPAGWGVDPLCSALDTGLPAPVAALERVGWTRTLPIRAVPPLTDRPPFFGHARLRRASAVTQYAAAAGLEAIAPLASSLQRKRLGLLLCLQIGPVQYASRLFQEILANPATASPMLFPETVFSAPASHLACLIGSPLLAHTIMGDASSFMQGLGLGIDWLIEDKVDYCLVVAAEELNWLIADAARHFHRKAVFGCGAGAVCLSRDASPGPAVELELLTDAHQYSESFPCAKAARQMRSQLPRGTAGELLCDGTGGAPRTVKAEQAAWCDWPGSRLSPRTILGDAFGAAAAWQTVAAVRAVSLGRFPAAICSVVGCTQQAIGARFITAKV